MILFFLLVVVPCANLPSLHCLPRLCCQLTFSPIQWDTSGIPVGCPAAKAAELLCCNGVVRDTSVKYSLVLAKVDSWLTARLETCLILVLA